MTSKTFSPKGLAEVIAVGMDFAEITALPILPEVSISVIAGADNDPSSMLSGSPTVSGSTVTQMLTGGVSGCVYKILFQCDTAEGLRYQESAYLPVVQK